MLISKEISTEEMHRLISLFHLKGLNLFYIKKARRSSVLKIQGSCARKHLLMPAAVLWSYLKTDVLSFWTLSLI